MPGIQTYTNTELKEFTVKTLYRVLLKNIKHYPSINALDILKETKSLFHLNKKLKDPKEITKEKKKAIMGIQHVLMYNEQNDYISKNYCNL